MAVKKVPKKNAGAGSGGSTKPNAIVLAGLKLFAQYGYRKTSMDDIANAAQVAKRTVYLHFENKAAVFLASDASSFITGVELFADGGMVQVSGA